jgi:hypothetical protein
MHNLDLETRQARGRPRRFILVMAVGQAILLGPANAGAFV